MVQLISGETPVYQLTVNQLLEILRKKEDASVSYEPKVHRAPRTYLYGLKELAQFLNCSMPTAQKIKDSGKVPYAQVGRKIVFDADEVLKSLSRKKAA